MPHTRFTEPHPPIPSLGLYAGMPGVMTPAEQESYRRVFGTSLATAAPAVLSPFTQARAAPALLTPAIQAQPGQFTTALAGPSPGPGSIIRVGAGTAFPVGLAIGAIAGLILGDDDNDNGIPPEGFSSEEAYLDYIGLGMYGREGAVSPGRTTAGTGSMAAGTFRAWDPIKQGYYGILPIQGQAYQGISFLPGNVIPGRGVITKTWYTHSTRKDMSLASTQFAMTADGRVYSLSETGIMKSWRPYKSIVIGKSLTTRNVKQVARRIRSHAKGLKQVLSCLK